MQLLVHISNQEAIKVDVEELPSSADVALICHNPRDKGDRELSWLEDGVRLIMIPWWRINYIQVLPGDEEGQDFPMPFRND